MFFHSTKQFFQAIPTAMGLDISDSSLKFVQLEPKGKYYKLGAYGERDIPLGIVESGKVKDPKMLAAILKESFKEKDLSPYVVASLPDEEVFLKMVTLPKVPKKELNNVVLVEAERNIPIPSDNRYLDHKTLDFHSDKKHIDVLLAAAKKDSVEGYIEAIKGAGLKPIAIEPEVAAISRSAIKDEKTKKPVIVLEVGANRTRLIVFVKNAPIITGAADFSAMAITKTMASVFDISEEKAQELRWTPDLLKDEKTADKLEAALRPLYKNLVWSINTYTSFLKDQEDTESLGINQLGKVIISGGGARVPGIANSISLELGIPVELANPWVNVLPPKLEETPELPRAEAVRFTTAIGLALHGANLKPSL